jgi:hypothetical protein
MCARALRRFPVLGGSGGNTRKVTSPFRGKPHASTTAGLTRIPLSPARTPWSLSCRPTRTRCTPVQRRHTSGSIEQSPRACECATRTRPSSDDPRDRSAAGDSALDSVDPRPYRGASQDGPQDRAERQRGNTDRDECGNADRDKCGNTGSPLVRGRLDRVPADRPPHPATKARVPSHGCGPVTRARHQPAIRA